MRYLLFFFFMITAMFRAQDVEEMQDGLSFSETSKNFFRVDIKKPFDYYLIPSCTPQDSFFRAQFPGGDAAFAAELYKYISAYVDREIYVVNGPFFIHLDIDKHGKVIDLQITPQVENADTFLRDLRFAARKIRKNWSPSTCNGKPVNSRLRIRLNFVTESIDI